MNPEIKNRIEQIKKGDIPKGYTKKYKYVFPDTWKLVNLGSVTKRKSEKNKNRNDLKSYSINNQVGFIQQDEQFSEGSYQDVDKTNYKVVKPGEFAYNPARINIGSIGLQKEDADVIISSLYVCFGLDKSYSKTYFENWFKSYDFNKEITRNLEGSVREYLFYENFSNIKLPIPSLAEQEKIAEILMQCDKLIELYQNETDELQKLKKICLCNMFPKNGNDIPKWRFPQFTDAWEQRKFEEIALRSSVICSDDTLPRVEYEDIVSGTGRLNKDIYAKQSSKSGIAFHQGDVLYGKLRPYLQNWLLPAFDGLAVGDFWVLQPQNADSSFLYRLIQSRQFDEVANQSTGTKMPRADWKLVSKTVFSIPSNISEQAAIGTYFTALDSLITLHQRKLAEMEKYKKSLMQLLLTGIVRV